MTQPDSFAKLPVGQFLDALAAGTPAPAGGSAAALTVAQAAALCAKAARLSARQLTADRATLLTVEAERIRAEVAALIDADAEAYRAVIEQARLVAAARREAGAAPGSQDVPDSRGATDGPGATDEGDAVGRLALALSHAADVPMRVVEQAAQVAEIAAPLAAYGNPALRGDAVTAALLAQAGEVRRDPGHGELGRRARRPAPGPRVRPAVRHRPGRGQGRRRALRPSLPRGGPLLL